MKKMAILAASSALIFAACSGDETTNVTEVTESTGLDVVAKGEKMPACDTANVGQMIFVMDSSAVYYCADGEWTTLNGKDGAAGKDGEDGKSVKGEDGTSCTAKEVDEGIEVSCGGKVVGTIKNGEPGEDLVNQNGTISYFIDSRDGKQYKAVTIGTQTWMAENLNYDYVVNNENDQVVLSNYCYGDEMNNCTSLGRLYTWAAAVDSAGLFSFDSKECGSDAKCAMNEPVRGICPQGWRLPSKDDWNEFLEYVDENKGSSTIIESLTAYGTNIFGFSAVTGGYRKLDGSYIDKNGYGYFWASTQDVGNGAFRWAIGTNQNVTSVNKKLAFSVRCLKD